MRGSKSILYLLDSCNLKASKCMCFFLLLMVTAFFTGATLFMPVSADSTQVNKEGLYAVSPVKQQMKLTIPSEVLPGGRGFMIPQVVVARDADGNPLSGIPVRFEVITSLNVNAIMRGCKTRNIVVNTDENGYASAANTYAGYVGEGFQIYSKSAGVVENLKVIASVSGWEPVVFDIEIGTHRSNMYDNTPPILTPIAKDEDGNLYVAGTWTNQSVTVHYDVIDTISGIKSCTEDQLFENEGADQQANGTAVDAANNSASISFGPVNIDKSPPVTTATATEPTYENWNKGNVIIDLKATDSVSEVEYIFYKLGDSEPVKVDGSSAKVEVDTEGATEVGYWAVDKAGNTEKVNLLTVNVDKTAPEVTWNQSPKENEKGWNSSDVSITIKAEDINSGFKELHYKIGDGEEQTTDENTVAFSVSDEGTTTVSYWAVDNTGLSSEITTKEVKIDKTVPQMNIPQNIVVEADAVYTSVYIGKATVIDISPYELENDAPEKFPIGNTTIKWSVEDSVGNITSSVQTVTVKDTTNPILTVQGDLVFEATDRKMPLVLEQPEATDIFKVTITNDAPEYFTLGETIVTWTAEDANNNKVTGTQKVIVVDSTKPELIVPSKVVKEAVARNTPVDIGEGIATDIFDVVITNNSPKTFAVGTTTVVWKAEDANGNVTLKEQIVEIIDKTLPVLTIPEDITLEATKKTMAIDIGKASTKDIFKVIIKNDAPEYYKVGTTEVTWTAVDENNNISKKTQKITVTDKTNPVLTVPADIKVEANGVLSKVDIGSAKVCDIFETNTVNNAPEGFPIGTTIVTWTATDENGNSTKDTQKITVVDTTKPLLTVPLDIEVEADGQRTKVDMGNFKAKDIFPVTVTNDAPLDYGIGTTEVTWKAVDINGNANIGKQCITVIDTTAPKLEVPQDIIVDAIGEKTPVDIGKASAKDIFPVTVINDAPEEFPIGTTMVTWSAIDVNGNVSTAVQLVTVNKSVKISVEAYNYNRNNYTNQIIPFVRVTNTGDTVIDLSKLKIRYYYTMNGDREQNYWCYFAQIQSAHYTSITKDIKGSFVTGLNNPLSDCYLEISVASDSLSLNPGESLMLLNRFSKTDWSNYKQSDDYSFNSIAQFLQSTEKITVYYFDKLISGVEP